MQPWVRTAQQGKQTVSQFQYKFVLTFYNGFIPHGQNISAASTACCTLPASHNGVGILDDLQWADTLKLLLKNVMWSLDGQALII